MEIKNGDKTWGLLMDRFNAIEEKLDEYAAAITAVQTNFSGCQSAHAERAKSMSAAIKWLFGIVAVVAGALVVEALKR